MEVELVEPNTLKEDLAKVTGDLNSNMPIQWLNNKYSYINCRDSFSSNSVTSPNQISNYSNISNIRRQLEITCSFHSIRPYRINHSSSTLDLMGPSLEIVTLRIQVPRVLQLTTGASWAQIANLRRSKLLMVLKKFSFSFQLQLLVGSHLKIKGTTSLGCLWGTNIGIESNKYMRSREKYSRTPSLKEQLLLNNSCSAMHMTCTIQIRIIRKERNICNIRIPNYFNKMQHFLLELTIMVWVPLSIEEEELQLQTTRIQ